MGPDWRDAQRPATRVKTVEMEPAGNRNLARRRMPQSKRRAEVNDVRSVITELRVIAQDGEHEPAVRQVCADAADLLAYLRPVEARGLERPGSGIFRPLTLEDWIE